MTLSTLSAAMPLHGEVDRAHATWVGLVEAADALASAAIVDLSLGDAFDRARLLVRDRGSVRGYVTLPVVDGGVDGAALAAAVSALPEVAAASRPAPRLISVVVCTRDRAALLRESLTAIEGLDYPMIDVVVVDNAPATEETADLMREEFPGFRYVREDAAGLSHARNAGLRAAAGSIVAFTDDDVIVDPQWLWAIASGFARSDDVGCVSGVVPSGELRNDVQTYFDARVSWSKLTTGREFRLSDPPADLPMFPFCVGEFGTGANFAARRDHLLGLGGFDTALGAGTRTKGGEDLDLFLRVLYDGQSIVVDPAAIVWHRHRDDLDALKAQAIGYGRGFGAWATIVLTDGRMRGAAVARAPRAVARLLHKPMSTVDDGAQATAVTPSTVSTKGVGRLELAAILQGPSSYFAERAAQRAAGTLSGPPSRGPQLERRCWAALAAVAAVFGILAALPLPAGLSFTFLAVFLLVGPGALLRAWVPMPAGFAPLVIPAFGVSVAILLATAMVFSALWSPPASIVVLAAATCALSLVSMRTRRTA